MTYSNWLKVDLHIHSPASNTTKKNDYCGQGFTANQLLSALDNENINLFSITDHNCINLEIYNELMNKRIDLKNNGKNFIIGCELDILDNRIFSKIFHALLFFDTDELDIEKLGKIKTIIEELTTSISSQPQPSLGDIFQKMGEHNQPNFILIPHFNNKSKGLDVLVVKKSLPMMVFDAFEDTNNITKIEESFKQYLKAGYDDFPVCIFSDCHDINAYPQQHDGENKTITFPYILGNINYPFSSLKVAFQDASLRIAFDPIHSSRNTNSKGNYIEEIHIDETQISLSPYQNTIIGGFGSGKSFLMDLIKKGKDNCNVHYKELTSSLLSFKLIMSDKTERDSLKQADGICILNFEQDKELFHIKTIGEEAKKKLEQNLSISFPVLSPVEDMSFNKLRDAFQKTNEVFDRSSSIADRINYTHLANEKNRFRVEDQAIKYSDLRIEENNLEEMLMSEIDRTIFGMSFYDNNEKIALESAAKLITAKNNYWKLNLELYTKINTSIRERNNKFNADQLSEHKELDATIKISSNIKRHIKQMKESLTELYQECNVAEQTLCQSKFDALSSTIKSEKYLQYSFITKYHRNVDYVEAINEIFKKPSREKTFFLSLLSSLLKKDGFHNNNQFEVNLSTYYKKYFFTNFTNFEYDILRDERSIMQKSAGEKANFLMDLIFSILEEKTKKEVATILLIDQPEDNLDNKNINSQIVNNLTRMKRNNTLPQCIFVSHNANIAISADSENIIIAEKRGNTCCYRNSGIEDVSFMKTVCSIMEGGQEALKRRGMKFLVSYQKKYEAKEGNSNE